ncbi:MAG: HesA/MoeB/ThiF family protein [Candidatus Hodarchaeales archaeon]|jgi:ubiquitin-like modifier-activating enzyme 5
MKKETYLSDENRYTRLKALQEFGYDVNFDKLRDKKVIIAGVGGIGAVSAEILSRCGIGTIVLLDMDIIEEVNLNRLGFRSEDIGKPKVEAVKRYLGEINPDVEVELNNGDICAGEFEKKFESILSSADLLLIGLDNVPTRQYVNIKCVKTKTNYIDSGASRSGLGGYVQYISPGETPCYQCMGAIVFSKKIVQGKPCTASLPTTISIVASLQSQYCLNYLLDFGTYPEYTAYNAVTNTFETVPVQRDPKCYVCSDKALVTEMEDQELFKELGKENIKDLIENLKKYEE